MVRVEPVCVINSAGRHAAKAATDAQRSAARAEAEDRVRAASIDATDGDLKAAVSRITPDLRAAVIRALTQAMIRMIEGSALADGQLALTSWRGEVYTVRVDDVDGAFAAFTAGASVSASTSWALGERLAAPLKSGGLEAYRTLVGWWAGGLYWSGTSLVGLSSAHRRQVTRCRGRCGSAAARVARTPQRGAPPQAQAHSARPAPVQLAAERAQQALRLCDRPPRGLGPRG
jgi:hypothetical protein